MWSIVGFFSCTVYFFSAASFDPMIRLYVLTFISFPSIGNERSFQKNHWKTFHIMTPYKNVSAAAPPQHTSQNPAKAIIQYFHCL